MKKKLAFILFLSVILSLCACGNSESSATIPSDNVDSHLASDEQSTESLLDNSQMIGVGSKIALSFGNLLIQEYGYSEKVEAYILVTRSTSKRTVNGVTTEQTSEKQIPHYLSKKDDYIFFALKGTITNTSSNEINYEEITSKAFFVPDVERKLNIFTGKPLDDSTEKTLAAGESSDILLYTTVPIDQFESENGALVLFDNTRMGISPDEAHYYASIGFEEEDGASISKEQLLTMIPTEVNELAPEEKEPETTAGEPIEKQPSTTGAAEGNAVKIEGVSVGFTDTLPSVIRSSTQYKADSDRYSISDSEIYAVIQFTLTNLTKEEIKIADIKDNFMVELNYNNGFVYSTDSEKYCFFVSGGNYMFLSKNASMGKTISVTPLATIDVTLYIPCAKAVSEEADKPLVVTFISTYAGRESFDFLIR